MSQELVRGVPHGDRPAQRYRTAVRYLVGGTRPARELTDLATAAAAPLATGRRIAVVSARGGAGKTTVAAVLASTFAARRAEPVLAVDADPVGGSLLWRLGLSGAPTLDRLAPALLDATEADRVQAVLGRARTGLWVLPGGTDTAERARDVTRALSRFFPIAVVDCGAGLRSAATAAVLVEAHAVLLVTPATPDGVRSTADALARATAPTLARIVVALNTVHRGGRRALRGSAARDALAGFDVPVLGLPYDRHLAGAAPIVTDRIGEHTTTAMARLACAVLDRARPLW